MLTQFGRGSEPSESTFEGLEITAGENGVPIKGYALGHLSRKPLGNKTTAQNLGQPAVEQA